MTNLTLLLNPRGGLYLKYSMILKKERARFIFQYRTLAADALLEDLSHTRGDPIIPLFLIDFDFRCGNITKWIQALYVMMY